MKTLVLLMLFSACAFASAQSLHVTAVRQWQPTDAPPFDRAFPVYVIIGTVGPEHYTLQQMKMWGTHLLQVGKDYPVLKATATRLTVSVPGKKGKADQERLAITGVSVPQ